MTQGFVITLDETRAVAMGGPFDTVNDLVQRILAKAKDLLSDNLPPWEVVEAAVVTAYDLYVRPLSLPNFLDNMVLKALVREVKKFYDSLATA